MNIEYQIIYKLLSNYETKYNRMEYTYLALLEQSLDYVGKKIFDIRHNERSITYNKKLVGDVFNNQYELSGVKLNHFLNEMFYKHMDLYGYRIKQELFAFQNDLESVHQRYFNIGMDPIHDQFVDPIIISRLLDDGTTEILQDRDDIIGPSN